MTDYEYRGLMAVTWDLFRGDTSRWDDRFFYLEAIRRYGQPALDVGCGTGRLLLDYLQQSIDIDGVDTSPEMLALCRQKAQAPGLAPTLYEQPMEALALPRTYRTILVPSSSFQLLTDRAQAREAMHRLHSHVVPGGVLVMPFMIEWQAGTPLELDWRVREQVRPEDGALMRRRSRVRYDPVEQLEHTEDIYEVVRDGTVVASEHHRRSPAVRWYTQTQASTLYREAGFVDVALYREFAFEPAGPDDAVFTIIGRRP